MFRSGINRPGTEVGLQLGDFDPQVRFDPFGYEPTMTVLAGTLVAAEDGIFQVLVNLRRIKLSKNLFPVLLDICGPGKSGF